MKKRILLSVIAAMCLFTASCGSKPVENTVETKTEEAEAAQVNTDVAPSDVTAAVLAEIPINSAIEKGIDDLQFYFTDLDTTAIESASYYMCASGAFPDEIAVLKFTSSELAEQGMTAVEKRLEKQISVFESYTPDEMYKLESAVIEVKQNYIFYSVTSDNARASEIMNGYIG